MPYEAQVHDDGTVTVEFYASKEALDEGRELETYLRTPPYPDREQQERRDPSKYVLLANRSPVPEPHVPLEPPDGWEQSEREAPEDFVLRIVADHRASSVHPENAPRSSGRAMKITDDQAANLHG